MTRTRKQIEAEVVRALRALRGADDARRRTLNRTLAELLVDYREHFLTPEGRPDWIGRTGPYRWAVRDLYSEAGYGKDEAAKVQSAVGYHVGNVLRSRLTAEEQEDLGLGISPFERSRQVNAERREALEEARRIIASRRKRK